MLPQTACIFLKKVLSLHCVFHSIRFKVNKGWDSAEPLFFCSAENTPFFFVLC